MTDAATTAEQFLALITSEFADAIRECVLAGRKPTYELADRGGDPVPSGRILAIFTLAGTRGVQWRDALRLSAARGPWRKALDSDAEQANLILRSGGVFSQRWLSRLAVGLEASADQRELILGFAGRVGGFSKPRPESIAAGIQAPVARDYSTALDYARAAIRDLTVLPEGYPHHLTMQDLSGSLTATLLPADATAKWATIGRLYSDEDSDGSPDDMPALEAIESISSTRVLLADPGHGKSTVLAAKALDALDHGRLGLFARVPDFARTLRGRIRLATANDVIAAVITAAGDRSQLWASDDVRRALEAALVSRSDSIVLLDGLDELGSAADLQIVRQALRILDRSGIATVISSRLTGYSSPVDGASEFLLNRLPPHQVDRFVSKWFAHDDLREFEGRARRVSDSESIVRIPLIIGFVCRIAQIEPVRTTLHGLYEQYLELFLQRRWKSADHWITWGEAMAKLDTATEVAWVMALPGVVDAPRGMPGQPPVWMDEATPHDLRTLSASLGDLESVLGSDGLLVPSASAGLNPVRQPYRWIHRTVHEHLAGRGLAERLRRDAASWGPVLRHVALRRRTWTVALQHAAGFFAKHGTLQPVIDYLLGESTLSISDANLDDDPLIRVVLDLLEWSHADYRRAELAHALARTGATSTATRLDLDAAFEYWHAADLSQCPKAELVDAAGWLARSARTEAQARMVIRLSRYIGTPLETTKAAGLIDPESARESALEILAEAPHLADQFGEILDALSTAHIDRVMDVLRDNLTSMAAVSAILSALYESNSEFVTRRLKTLRESDGAVGALLTEIYLHQRDHGPDRPIRLADADARELIAGRAPAWATYAYVAEGAPVPSGWPKGEWARAGLSVRRLVDGGVSVGTWDAARAVQVLSHAVAAPRDLGPGDVEAVWDACLWALSNRRDVPEAAVEAMIHMVSLAFRPDAPWWLYKADELRKRVARMSWDLLMRATKRSAESGNDLSLWAISEAFEDSSESEVGIRLHDLQRLALDHFPRSPHFPVPPSGHPDSIQLLTRSAIDSIPDGAALGTGRAQLDALARWALDHEVLDDSWNEWRQKYSTLES